MKNLLFALIFLGSGAAQGAGILSVCSTCEYKTIKEALQAAQPGSIIEIGEGLYAEHDLAIEKKLTLKGKGKAIIDVAHQGFGLVISASDVTITGLHIKNIKTGSIQDYAAISAHDCSNLSIQNCTIEGSFFGIHLFGVNQFTIEGNSVSGKPGQKMLANGIHTQNSRYGRIMNNKVVQCRDGIYLEFTDSTQVENNTARNNRRYGLHFMFSNHDRYHRNIFDHNEAGVAVMYSSHIEMTKNTFVNNWGTACYGLLLKDIDDCNVSQNNFDHNTSAMLMDGSNRVTVVNNTFRGSGWAIRLLANCTDPIISHNVFLGNVFDLATNGNPTIKEMRGNYWDKYSGYDLDRDGIGDVAFHPVSLYSVLVERQPELITLHRSFITNLIDWSDRSLPCFTPPNLVDPYPLMRTPQHAH